MSICVNGVLFEEKGDSSSLSLSGLPLDTAFIRSSSTWYNPESASRRLTRVEASIRSSGYIEGDLYPLAVAGISEKNLLLDVDLGTHSPSEVSLKK